MSLRLFTILIACSFLFAGCHDAAAELLHGSPGSGDACCAKDGDASAHGAHADALLADCCAGCADDPDCDCGEGCTNCAECPTCTDCERCAECEMDCCEADAKDGARAELEQLAPAGLEQDG